MNKEKKLILLLFISSLVLVFSSVGVFIGLDAPLYKSDVIKFTDEENETLVGKYYPGEVSAGIIFLEGFGSDQVALRSVMSEFYRLGIHMFSFDRCYTL